MRGLTRRQAEALSLIRDRLAEDRVTPTLQEIADLVGYRARSAAHRMVGALIARGYLAWTGRGFRTLDVPEAAPAIAFVEQKVERIVNQTVVLGVIAEHPPCDQAKSPRTRKKRTYVVELERDLHIRLRRLARSAEAPPERIIAMALRDYIMERDAA